MTVNLEETHGYDVEDDFSFFPMYDDLIGANGDDPFKNLPFEEQFAFWEEHPLLPRYFNFLPNDDKILERLGDYLYYPIRLLNQSADTVNIEQQIKNELSKIFCNNGILPNAQYEEEVFGYRCNMDNYICLLTELIRETIMSELEIDLRYMRKLNVFDIFLIIYPGFEPKIPLRVAANDFEKVQGKNTRNVYCVLDTNRQWKNVQRYYVPNKIDLSMVKAIAIPIKEIEYILQKRDYCVSDIEDKVDSILNSILEIMNSFNINLPVIDISYSFELKTIDLNPSAERVKRRIKFFNDHPEWKRYHKL